MALHYENTLGKNILKAIQYNFVFCTIIAVLIYFFGFAPEGKDPSFLHNFVFSQSVGNLCCIFSIISNHFFKNSKIQYYLFFVIASLVMGTVAGLFVGSIILGIDPQIFIQQYVFFFKLLFGTILFGSVIIYFWHSHDKIIQMQARAHEERIKRLSSEKEVVEANLKMLQAQIEPHFLFNALSNVLSLLNSDPEKGKSMLSDLTHYLRTSLSKTRKDTSTIEQEIELIQDYLKIFKVRIGNRLNYLIDIQDSIRGITFPPMLIQPLVENAIKHGIEPKVEGGEVTIIASVNQNKLRITVSDTGLGLQANQESGTGLNNIRERLESLFGDDASFRLEENFPSGLKAIIEVPYAAD